jgi:hypothetical protein
MHTYRRQYSRPDAIFAFDLPLPDCALSGVRYGVLAANA